MTPPSRLPKLFAVLVASMLIGCDAVQNQVLPEERILSRSARGFQPDGPWTFVRVEDDLAVVVRNGEVEKKVYPAMLLCGGSLPGLADAKLHLLQKEGLEEEIRTSVDKDDLWIDPRQKVGDRQWVDLYAPYDTIEFHNVRTGKTDHKCLAWEYINAEAIWLGGGFVDETQDHPLKKEMLILQADAKCHGNKIWGISRQVQLEDSELPDGSPGKRVCRLDTTPGFVGQRWRYRGVTDNLEIVLDRKESQGLFTETVKLAGICSVGEKEGLLKQRALLEQYFANCRGISSQFGLGWHTRLSDRKSLAQLYVPTRGEEISNAPGGPLWLHVTEWRFVNADLVALGCAIVDPGDDVPYMTGLLDLQAHAKKMAYGIWGTTKTMPPTPAPCPEPKDKEEEPLIFDKNGKLIRGTLPKPKEGSPDHPPGSP